ncbi:right-handed parallel beta-helix repeat-containing protein [Mucilaginibacter conchicola]|nr:right-handed parallel beta-helix repeat-containing protein [Mucilaginibacter conchicola]
MKKIIGIAIFFLCIVKAYGTTYYVDSKGNDNNSGKSPDKAWATLKKANEAVLMPGDKVLFIKGASWYGTIIPNRSSYSTSSNPVTWSSYGTGANPLISGFIKASGWVNKGGGIWSFTSPALTKMPGILTINGKVEHLGRFPKNTFNTYSSHTQKSSITDAKFTGGKSFVGGEIVIRTAHFVWSKGNIISQAGGHFNYQSDSDYEPVNGYTYFIQNHVNCLSQFGDWCYDKATKTVSVFFGAGSNPSDYAVKLSSLPTLVSVSSETPCNSFIGIDFEGADAAFAGTGADHTVIRDCNIKAIGDNAIDFGHSNNLTITGNNITDCNNTAIACWYGTSNSTISSNTIYRSGAVAGAGENDTGGKYNKGAYSGIVISDLGLSKSNKVEYNHLTNVGYNGIQVNGHSYVVNNNFVDSACAVLDDGGGIYTYVGREAIAYADRVISNNIVLNSVGSHLFDYEIASGIYLDDNSSNITVSGNTVANCKTHGYYLHNCHDVVFSDNFSYDNGLAQLFIVYDDNVPSLAGKSKRVTMSGNTLVNKTNKQLGMLFQSVGYNSSVTDFQMFGTSTNAVYGSLSATKSIVTTAINWATSTISDLTGWKTISKTDQNSTFYSPTYISASFQYNNKLTEQTISLNGIFKDITGKTYTGNVKIAPFKSLLLLSQSPNCVIKKPVILWDN